LPQGWKPCHSEGLLLAALPGGLASTLAERFAEVLGVAEAAGFGDAVYGERGLFEQVGGVVEAGIDQVFHGSAFEVLRVERGES